MFMSCNSIEKTHVFCKIANTPADELMVAQAASILNAADLYHKLHDKLQYKSDVVENTLKSHS